MAVTELARARYEVCAPGTPQLAEEEAAELYGAKVNDSDRDGSRSLRMSSWFRIPEAFSFVARAALIAEAEEPHHPDIELTQDRASF